MKFLMVDFQHIGAGAFGTFGLTTLLRTQGYEASVVGGPSIQEVLEDKEKFVSVLRAEKPDFVGLSVFTPYADYVDVVGKIVKETLGDVPVILGGYHSTMFGHKVFEHFEHIDYAVVGDAEVSLPLLLQSIQKGTNDPITGALRRHPVLKKVQNIDFNVKASIPLDQIAKATSILDDIPYPDEETIHPAYYNPSIMSGHASVPSPSRYVLFSRGCPFTCTFCKLDRDGGFRTKMRYYSPKKAVEILSELVERYGLKGVTFIDDNFTLNKKWAYEICEGIKKNKLKIEWQAQIRADLMDVDLVKCMRDAGCTVATITIESGNDRIRTKVFEKRVSREELRFAYKYARELDMLIQGTLIMAAPTETYEELQDSVALLRELDPDWAGVLLTTPIPGTPLWDRVADKIKVTRWGDYEIAIQPDHYKSDKVRLGFHEIPVDKLLETYQSVRAEYEYSNRSRQILRNLKSKERLKWLLRERRKIGKGFRPFDKFHLRPSAAIEHS